MAFNPFQSFRKHSKKYFAALTIICMVTFILAFGQGDVFNTLLSGRGGQKGDEVTVLYGDKVYQGDIGDLHERRQSANRFVTLAVVDSIRAAETNLIDRLAEPLPEKASDEEQRARRSLQNALSTHMLIRGTPATDKRLAKLFAADRSFETLYKQQIELLRQRQDMFMNLMSQQGFQLLILRSMLEEKKDAEVLQLVSALQLANDLIQYDPMAEIRGEPSRLLFGGGLDRQELLDFMVWLKQADNLGIQLTDAGVREAVNNLTPSEHALTGDGARDTAVLRKHIPPTRDEKQRRDIDLDTLYRAIGDEIRVSLAQQAILGREPGLFGVARAGREESSQRATPYDYLEHYRGQRTSSDAVLLPIRVEAFLNQAQEPPTEKVLEELYEQYRNNLPSPASATPGFRKPPRVQIEWVGLKSISKQTFEHTANVVPLTGYALLLEDRREKGYVAKAEKSLRAQTSFFSADPLTALVNVTTPVAHYEEALKRARGRYELPQGLLYADPGLSMNAVSNVSAAAAGTVGELASGFGLLPLVPDSRGSTFDPVPPSRLESILKASNDLLTDYPEAVFKDAKEYAAALQRERARRATAMVGNAFGSGFSSLFPAQSAEAPADAVAQQILARAHQARGNELSFADLRRIILEMQEAARQPEKAKDVAAKLVKECDLQNRHGKSASLKDVYDLVKDPALAPLFAEMKSPGEGIETTVANANRRFFGKDVEGREVNLYAPKSLFEDYLWWKTAKEPAVTLSYGEARPQVLAAWQLMEARKRARAKADEIRARVAGKSEKEAREILAQELQSQPSWGRELIDLDAVVKQKLVEVPRANSSPSYVPYTIPEEKVPFAPADLVPEILRLGEKDAAVFADRAEKVIYVAYVEKKAETPNPVVMLKEVVGADYDKPNANLLNFNFPGRDSLWESLTSEKLNNRQKAIVEELRRQAGKLDARGRFQVNPKLKTEGGEGRESREPFE